MQKPNKILIKETWAEVIIESPKYGNKIVKIDIEDVPKLANMRIFISNEGHKSDLFYAEMYLKDGSNKKIRLHRYLVNCPEGMVVDHINFDSLDNRKSNLRICTPSFNSKHKNLEIATCSTMHRHIHFYRNQYRVEIFKKRTRIFQKTCKTLEEAIAAKEAYYENLQQGTNSAEKRFVA